MKKFGIMNILFDQATDGTGGSSAGGSSAGGSSLLGANGNTPSANAQTSQGNQSTEGAKNESGASANPTGSSAAAAWLSALPKELQEDASIKKFADVQGLAQSYINAQKLIGADKIPVPSKHATEEDWKQVFHKLGLPEDAAKYEIKFAEQASLDKKFAEDFKNLAYKSGILPKQAQALADWFSEVNQNSEKIVVEERQKTIEKEIAGLKNEWGNAFDSKLAYANNALAKYADKETVEYLAKTGLGNDVRLVKLLSNLGEQLFKEGKIPQGGTSSPGLTPAEAKKQAQMIIGNPEHPYHNKMHPGHKSAVAEVSDLFKQASAKSS